MKKIILILPLLLLAMPLGAQTITGTEHSDPATPRKNAAPARSEFISWDVRADAEKGDWSKNPYVVDLSEGFLTQDGFRTSVEIPYLWLDRELFVYTRGLPAYYISVNGNKVGYASDNRTPVEFNISSFAVDGTNTILLEFAEGAAGAMLDYNGSPTPQPEMYLYSQPKIRIGDYRMTAVPDSLNDHGIFSLELVLDNSYNSAETITVGYDIYAPHGKLQYYDMREVTVPGRGTDTVRFRELIYGTPDNLWSASKPALYYGMMTVQRDRRMVEYIPFRIGFATTEVRDGIIYRNGQPVEIRAVRYNVSSGVAETEKELEAVKKAGFNTVAGDYPQPVWFYALCDRLGLYVIDQANNNSDRMGGNREAGGALTNDPAWLPSYLGRAETMYERTKNRTCVIGWSIGGMAGNGYNMYKSYQWLRSADPDRAVIYNDAGGEWNTDLVSVEISDKY